jgi:hypothetical protein
MTHAIKTHLTIDAELQKKIISAVVDQWLEITTWWSPARPFDGIGFGDYSFIDDQQVGPVGSEDWIYNKYQSRPDLFGGSGEFYMAILPPDIVNELLNLLPISLLTALPAPVVRVQVSKNYQLVPHSDLRRSVVLIACVTDHDSLADTVFYDVNTCHNFFQNRLPDPDSLVEIERYKFLPGEVWLMDTLGVHSTAGRSPLRITVNYGWYDLTMQDLLPYLS